MGCFFVSRRFASRIHEISDLKIALVLSLSAEYTRLKDQKKHTEQDRNAKRERISVVFSRKRGARYRIFVNVGSPCAQVRVTCGQAVNAEL